MIQKPLRFEFQNLSKIVERIGSELGFHITIDGHDDPLFEVAYQNDCPLEAFLLLLCKEARCTLKIEPKPPIDEQIAYAQSRAPKPPFDPHNNQSGPHIILVR